MLDAKLKSTLKDAARKLTGPKKRAFMAKATEDYFDGSARKAETYLGWKRQTVRLGQHERRSGLTCVDNYRARGRKKSEENQPQLAADIHELVSEQTQADPQLKSALAYTKVTAGAVLEDWSAKRDTRNRHCPVVRRWGAFSIGSTIG